MRILEAGTRPFQLLITDLVLRGIGGQEVVDHLRSTEPGTKAIFMSGYAGGRTSSSSLRQSGLAYLQKPFTPVDLARQVRASLEARPRPPVRKPKGRGRKPKSP